MAMGMSYEQYWYGEADMAAAYRKAQRLRNELQNQNAWLNGLYASIAFGTVLGNAFRKKGESAKNYPDKPLPLYGKTKEEKKAEEQKEWEIIYAKIRADQKRKKSTAKK